MESHLAGYQTDKRNHSSDQNFILFEDKKSELAKMIQSYNQGFAEKQRLRSKIDLFRQERVFHDKIFRNLELEIKNQERFLTNLLESHQLKKEIDSSKMIKSHLFAFQEQQEETTKLKTTDNFKISVRNSLENPGINNQQFGVFVEKNEKVQNLNVKEKNYSANRRGSYIVRKNVIKNQKDSKWTSFSIFEKISKIESILHFAREFLNVKDVCSFEKEADQLEIDNLQSFEEHSVLEQKVDLKVLCIGRQT